MFIKRNFRRKISFTLASIHRLKPLADKGLGVCQSAMRPFWRESTTELTEGRHPRHQTLPRSQFINWTSTMDPLHGKLLKDICQLSKTWQLFCPTAVQKHERSRHSSTPVWGVSTISNGKRRSEMKICGNERDRNQWPSRYCRGSGAGSDTPSGSQHPAPHTKPWPGTRRGRGREAGLATVGDETLKQSWSSRGPAGPEWQEQPRTECDGGGSLTAYTPLGAMGTSK